MFETLREVDPLEARGLVSSGVAVLLDVREADEWEAGHAPEAIHVPLSTADERLRELTAKLTDDQLLVVVCRSGRRSALAVGRLRAAGRAAYNLRGGMQAWSLAGLPVCRPGGRPGTVI
ncbi:rhodanese-like domain-containing protein [Streptantibioticus ferralitis]|uniref:Rhodanese-like domain-containing protein n=1 Tax=Streptantibioticus ferralitis TaxID=236510 RepID=A0ABT5YUQ3_9ACTN|nr:rhodanese-like domain-containing protein [Streptantibioticus ferralitis]MDF2255341.1 rhodanese-like domain-containing protein [Streptantibioticus ferralitis]